MQVGQMGQVPMFGFGAPVPIRSQGPLATNGAQGPDGQWRAKAEHGDLAHLARLHGLSLREVRRQIEPFMQTPAAAPTAKPVPYLHEGELP